MELRATKVRVLTQPGTSASLHLPNSAGRGDQWSNEQHTSNLAAFSTGRLRYLRDDRGFTKPLATVQWQLLGDGSACECTMFRP